MSFSFFNKNGSGLSNSCKQCIKDSRKKYANTIKAHHERYKETHLAKRKVWRAQNKERIQKWRKEYYALNKQRMIENTKNWKAKNRTKIRQYVRNKIKTDINFRLAERLRGRLSTALKSKNNRKNTSTLELLGCSSDYLRQYLQSKFDSNMSWDNYGSYWHIDHIIPLSSFDLSDPEQLKKACHYTNLQPLEAIENIKKGNKLPNTFSA